MKKLIIPFVICAPILFTSTYAASSASVLQDQSREAVNKIASKALGTYAHRNYNHGYHHGYRYGNPNRWHYRDGYHRGGHYRYWHNGRWYYNKPHRHRYDYRW